MEIPQEKLARQKEEWDWLMNHLNEMIDLILDIRSKNPDFVELTEDQESQLRSAEKARNRRQWSLTDE